MRTPSDLPRPRPRQRRRLSRRGNMILGFVVGVIALLVLSLSAIARVYTDFLWFDSLDLSSVWTGVLRAKVSLVAIFTLVFFALMYVSLLAADRLAPRFRPPGPEDDLLDRYREVVGSRQGTVRFVVSISFALIAGLGVSGQWNEWILFQNRQSFGVRDAQFDTDVGFYVFELPFYSYVVTWLFASLVIVTIVTGVAHYFNGGIRMQVSGDRVTPQVKVHLSVLLALMALVKVADYWLGRFELTLSSRGVVDGALYTDVKAQLPAVHLLMLISAFAAALFVFNIWRKGWVFPVLAVGLWALVALVAQTAYPAFIQQFQVQPRESEREEPYIARNIDATRAAFGLDEVRIERFDYDASVTTEQVANSKETLQFARLLDPDAVLDTFVREEQEFPFYRFVDLDIDRYVIDGVQTPVVVGSRELNLDGTQNQSWEAQHLIYTHGYGLALAPANQTDAAGLPEFLVSGAGVEIIDNAGLGIEQPEIYVGEFDEDANTYAVVGSTRQEQDSGGDAQYAGSGGVGIGGLASRLAYAIRFGSPELFFSGYLTGDSRVIYDRDVRERLDAVAPFLEWDANPYPAVVGGRIVYVVDGYTTTAHYPYSQRVDGNSVSLAAESDLAGSSFNYIRNSVKAVVDSYDGTVELYLVDELTGEEDPLARAYAQAFPALFSPVEEAPPELVDNFRYAEDLFRVQTHMWGEYHVDDATEFYQGDQIWTVARDPGAQIDTTGNAQPTTTSAVDALDGGVNQQATAGSPAPQIAPIYEQMQLPGESGPEFVVTRPFVPRSNESQTELLTGLMAGRSDPEHYGELVVYEMSRVDAEASGSRDVPGPLLVAAEMNNNETVSRLNSFYEGAGSRVSFGQMLILPIDGSLLYIRPMYLESAGNAPLPRLQRVVVSVGNEVAVCDTLADSLLELFPGLDTTFLPSPPSDNRTAACGVPEGDGSDALNENEDEDDSSTTTEPDQSSTTAPPDGATTSSTLPSGTDINTLLATALTRLDQADDAAAARDYDEAARLYAEARALLDEAAGQPGATTPTGEPSGSSATTTTNAPTDDPGDA